MSLDNSNTDEPAETTPAAEISPVIQTREQPRRRYSPPSAPRVLNCLRQPESPKT